MFHSVHSHQFTHTLCPYTTLFRSPQSVCHILAPLDSHVIPSVAFELNVGSCVRGRARMLKSYMSAYTCCTAATARWTAVDTDRKSTRLNSSHVAISYAVCCLKNKR